MRLTSRFGRYNAIRKDRPLNALLPRITTR